MRSFNALEILILHKMMENLGIELGDFAKLRTVDLPKATFVRFQPQTKEFHEIYNPKAVYVPAF
jgi:ubiquitin fusion degradation protein 1